MQSGGEPVRILLGSGGIGTEERRELYRSLLVEHFEGCSEVLFVPYASSDHKDYTSRMQSLAAIGPGLVGIESFESPIDAIMEAQGIYVGGGNSFLLIRELHERSLIGPIRELVSGGASYLGVSAGSNVASPSMMTTNDMPITYPPSFDSIGLVPFQINPHYHPGKILFRDGEEISEHFGESRGQRISEFHQYHETPVLGMWEGSFVHWDGSEGRLSGRATVFRNGSDPLQIEDGTRFDSGLNQLD
jgi:dipeptidase E